RRFGEVDPELERRLERPVLRGVRPELGRRPAGWVDVDADRDDPAQNEEGDDQDDRDEPGQALGHYAHSTADCRGPSGCTLAARAARVAESLSVEVGAIPGSDPAPAALFALRESRGLTPTRETSMRYDTITLERAQGVATITLNRPEAYNALNLT